MSTPRNAALLWLERAATALASQGPEGITIDALCRATGKTKGSFYAHFASHEAFLTALAEHWRRRDTEGPIALAEQSPAPMQRLAALNHLVVRMDLGLERGIARLAPASPAVARVAAEVEARRITYLAEQYRAAGHAGADAVDLALLGYATFLGLQALSLPLPPIEMERLYASFARLIGRPARERAP